ncbi:polycystin-1-like protein 2 [Branchiostoma lanceolatum]|uniref:polycystin-1-like protein 2 n=1 Tax=Branchiostoma lanceolatum TaxID=7740 RepID=UPI003452DB97
MVERVTSNSIELYLPAAADGASETFRLYYTDTVSRKTSSATFEGSQGLLTDLYPGVEYRLELTAVYSSYNVSCISSDGTKGQVDSPPTLHSSGTNITALTPGKTYNITINMFSPYTEGQITTLTITTERDAITDLEAVEVTGTSLSFQWSPPIASHLAFIVSLATSDGVEHSQRFTYEHSVEFTRLTPATLYTIGVQVLRSDSYPDPVVTLRVSTSIDPPTAFVVSITTTTTLTLTWNEPYATVTWYNITYCACAIDFQGNVDSATTVSLPASTEEYTIQELSPSTVYNISIVAWTLYEASERVMTNGNTDTEAPSELTVVQVTTASVSLSWVPPRQLPDHYVITYAHAFSGQSDAVTIEVDRNVGNIVLSGLSPGTEYTVGISATTELGESEVVDLNAITVTDAPSDVVITRSAVDPASAELSWTAPVAVIMGYTVTFSTSRVRSHRSVSQEESQSILVDRVVTDVTLYELLPVQYTVTIRAVGVYADSDEVAVVLEEYIAPTMSVTTDMAGELESDSYFDIDGSESFDSEADDNDETEPTDPSGTELPAEGLGEQLGTEMPRPVEEDLNPPQLKPAIDVLEGTVGNTTSAQEVSMDAKKFQDIIRGFIKALLEPRSMEELSATLNTFVKLHKRFPHLFKEFEDDVIYVGNRLLQGLESLGALDTESERLSELLRGLFDILGPYITIGDSEESSAHVDGHSIDVDLEGHSGDLLESDEDPWLDDVERGAFVEARSKKKQENISRVSAVLTTIDRAANVALRAVKADGRPIELRASGFEAKVMALSKGSARQGGRAFQIGGGSFSLPPLGEEDMKGVDKQVNLKVKSFRDNLFTWDTSLQHTSSPLMELTLLNDNFQTVHYQSEANYVTITLPRLTNHIPAPQHNVIMARRKQNKAVHAFNLTSPGYGFLLSLDFNPSNVICRIDLGYGDEPEVSKWDHIQGVVEDVGFKLRSSSNDSKVLLVNGTQVVKGNETVLVPDLAEIGSYHFALRFYGYDSEYEFYGTEYGTTFPMRIEYSMLVTTIGCRFRNETTDQWEDRGCKVSPKSTLTETVCLCNHLTMFATDAFVPPNSINFATVFSKPIHSSGIVLSTVIFLWLVLFVAMLYARLEDIKDRKKWVTSSLPDDNPHDQFKYEITVYTGTARKAGTRSKIAFLLCGENADTGVRIFDDKKDLFKAGSVNKFLMSTPRDLGSLTHMRIWHDNSGKWEHASWFLGRVKVHDLRTEQMSQFLCNGWLAVEDPEGIDRVIPVASPDELTSLGHLFRTSVRHVLTDKHLWYSILSRPTRSTFSRVERIMCGLSMLFSAMVASAMWYRPSDGAGGQNALRIGPVTLSVTTLYISFMTTLTVFPINFIIVRLFRKTRRNLNAVVPDDDEEEEEESTSTSQDDVVVITSSPPIMADAGCQTEDNDVIVYDIDEECGMECEVEEEEKNGAEQSSMEVARKKTGLPPWCIYIAWFLAFSVAFVSSFFVVLYSLEWGYKKSEEWFTSFAMSFFQSAFVFEPAKVILITSFLTYLRRKPADEDGASAMQERYFVQPAKPMDSAELRRRKKLPKENKGRLEVARHHRAKQVRMNRVIYETLSLLAFVIVLIVVTEVDRDPNAFYMDRSLRKTFVTGMDQVKTAQDFWEWTDAVLLPGVYFNTWYNGVLGRRADRLHLHDTVAYRFQPPRLRQLRVSPGHCMVDGSVKPRECTAGFSWNVQESGDFSAGWKPRGPDDNSTGPWTFRPAYELKGLPAFGQLSTYPGGGYVSIMKKSKIATMKRLEELKNNTWIDRYTRAVMVEFTVYAEGSNLLSSVNLIFEFSTTGAFVPHSTVNTYRLFNYEGSRGIVVIVFQMLFVTLLVYVAIREWEKAAKGKAKYIQDYWNVLEIATIVGGFVAVVMYGVREAFSNVALKDIKNSRYTDDGKMVVS